MTIPSIEVDALCTIISSIVVAILGLIGVMITYDNRRLKRELAAQRALSHTLRENLESLQGSYDRASEYITSHIEAPDLALPVLFIGPRNAGKSSLLRAWLAPWSELESASTTRIRMARILLGVSGPVTERAADFDEDIKISRQSQLVLRVIDVPGEETLQERAVAIWHDEVERFRAERKHVQMSVDGAVVILFFNLRDVFGDRPNADYYTGEFFLKLRNGASRPPGASVHRIIVVLNHSDGLPTELANVSHDTIIKHVRVKLENILTNLQDAVKSTNLSFVVTMLKSPSDDCRGSDVIKGLVSRDFVEFFTGERDKHAASFGSNYE